MGALFSGPNVPDMPQKTDASIQEAARQQADMIRQKRRRQSFLTTAYEPPPTVLKTQLGS